MNDAVYIGDGLYARFDGYRYEVFAHNGVETTNIVYLEPSVLKSFIKFVDETRYGK